MGLRGVLHSVSTKGAIYTMLGVAIQGRLRLGWAGKGARWRGGQLGRQGLACVCLPNPLAIAPLPPLYIAAVQFLPVQSGGCGNTCPSVDKVINGGTTGQALCRTTYNGETVYGEAGLVAE